MTGFLHEKEFSRKSFLKGGGALEHVPPVLHRLCDGAEEGRRRTQAPVGGEVATVADVVSPAVRDDGPLAVSVERAGQLTPRPPTAPLVTESTVPLPLIRSPCHVTSALRSVAIGSSLECRIHGHGGSGLDQGRKRAPLARRLRHRLEIPFAHSCYTRASVDLRGDNPVRAVLDLIERSLRIFDELIVAVVANPSKEPLFTAKERLELIDECTTGIGMSRMRITSFDGLLIDLVDREGADCIVRGLRAVSDFEYEFQMALMNRKLRSTVETVFMMPAEQYSYLSSRLVREVAKLGGSIEGLVPEMVERRLREKLEA